MIISGDTLKVDQTHLETVIPAQGMVLPNGRQVYRLVPLFFMQFLSRTFVKTFDF